MVLTVFKMDTKFTPLPQFDGERLRDALEAVYGAPTGSLGDSAIFTVDADHLEDVLSEGGLKREERKILKALLKRVRRHRFGVLEITFG